MSDHALRKRRVLVVEDEYFLADGLRSGLEQAGAVVGGPVDVRCLASRAGNRARGPTSH